MMELVHTTLAFLVALALLIAVHEYGHFIVARKLGIRVEKFSIGFGPALFSWRSRDREVEYVVAMIPLGGYVKMLGENPEEQTDEARARLSPEERARAFDAQPVWKRASVAAAGPMFNFLFAIVAYMIVGWMGQQVLPPVIGQVDPSSPAALAGLQEGDRIQTVDGRHVHSWSEVEELLKSRAGREVRLAVDRDGLVRQVSLEVPRPEIDPLLTDMAGRVLGMGPGVQVVVESVRPGSPAERAGLKAGDIILQAGGEPVRRLDDLIRVIRDHPDRPVALAVEREGLRVMLSVVPRPDADGVPKVGVGLALRSLQPREVYRMGLIEGLQYGFVRTWEMTELTLNVVAKMVTSAIPADNLGGPIAIAQLAGKTAELGLVSFLSFLALISVNLGVLNLMPIPILDGGHLVYLGLEKLRGRPLSPRTMEITQAIGLVLIAALMLFAFYNDLTR